MLMSSIIKSLLFIKNYFYGEEYNEYVFGEELNYFIDSDYSFYFVDLDSPSIYDLNLKNLILMKKP